MFHYFGDDDITRAAGYLCGVLQHCGLPFVHIDSCDAPPPGWEATIDATYILSDYPYGRLGADAAEAIRQAVAGGAGLLMIGGWESFHGIGDSPGGGGYVASSIAEILPVEMERTDDRCNCPQPVFVVPSATARALSNPHPILADLPWERPSAIGGFNRTTPKPQAEVLLEGIAPEIRLRENGALDLTTRETEKGGKVPLLVTGHHGQGRTAALAFDLAPHWVGQFVDWGAARVTQTLRGPGDGKIGFIEVGDAYVRFIRQLLIWLNGD